MTSIRKSGGNYDFVDSGYVEPLGPYDAKKIEDGYERARVRQERERIQIEEGYRRARIRQRRERMFRQIKKFFIATILVLGFFYVLNYIQENDIDLASKTTGFVELFEPKTNDNQQSSNLYTPIVIETPVKNSDVEPKPESKPNFDYFLDLIEPVEIKEIERSILKYTNIERKKNGLNELVWDKDLSNIARNHSIDMAENNFFSHDNLSGEDPTARAIRQGYIVHKELGDGWYSDGIAENIGKMATGNIQDFRYVLDNADDIGKAHVESWMESPGHRANILNSSYDKIGIGIAYDYPHYIGTQNFW